MSHSQQTTGLGEATRWLRAPVIGAQGLVTTRAGRLQALGAAVWVTREGDPDDTVLAPGEALAVRAGERLWLSSLGPGGTAQVHWQAAPAGAGTRHAVGARGLSREDAVPVQRGVAMVRRAALGIQRAVVRRARFVAALAGRFTGLA